MRPSPEVLSEFAAFTAELPDSLDWELAADAFGERPRDDYADELWGELADRIEACLESGTPGSFIRINDGEGNLLALRLGEYPALTDYCARTASLRHLGSPELLAAGAPELLDAYDATIRGADVIGIPGPTGASTILARPRKNSHLRTVHGLVCVHRYLARFASELELADKTAVPVGLHRGLLPHYDRLVRGRRIGIVTCHRELQTALQDAMGAASVDLRPVPKQARFSANPRADSGHWPNRYRELTAELREVEPGTLWFVAAGVIGKPYCEAIRSAGSVAVDIGHAADVWAGRRTRSYDQADVIESWSIV